MGTTLTTILITVAVFAIVLLLMFMIHQEVLFGRMIAQNEKVMETSSDRHKIILEQNNILLRHADERLESANKMVATLAHSADMLANSASDLKDLMLQLEETYTQKYKELSKNRDDIYHAYEKLLQTHMELQHKYDSHLEDGNRTLMEIARRPTSVHNNNIGE